MKWNMSKDDLEIGLTRLKRATYSQKTYCPLPMIEENDPLFPLSRYELYGAANERRFMIRRYRQADRVPGGRNAVPDDCVNDAGRSCERAAVILQNQKEPLKCSFVRNG